MIVMMIVMHVHVYGSPRRTFLISSTLCANLQRIPQELLQYAPIVNIISTISPWVPFIAALD